MYLTGIGAKPLESAIIHVSRQLLAVCHPGGPCKRKNQTQTSTVEKENPEIYDVLRKLRGLWGV